MTPLLDRPLTDYLFVPEDAETIARAEEALKQTAITQPAVLAADAALTRLLAAYGIVPDMVMGHSLGEYGALVAAGAMPLEDALEAVSARGREMASLTLEDCGAMAAVMAPIAEVERILASIDGYVAIANLNSTKQCVVGGETAAVERTVAAVQAAGFTAVPLPVSHAFHTRIVAPASEPLRRVLERLRLQAPVLPIVANVSGDFYPAGIGAAEIIDILARQVASPVQFVKGLRDALRKPGRGSSSRSDRSARCRASPTTSSADGRTSYPSSRTTRRCRTRSRSTRHCAGSTPPASGQDAPPLRCPTPA